MLKLIKLTVILLLLVSANFAQSPLLILMDGGIVDDRADVINLLHNDGAKNTTDFIQTAAFGDPDAILLNADFSITTEGTNRWLKVVRLGGANDYVGIQGINSGDYGSITAGHTYNIRIKFRSNGAAIRLIPLGTATQELPVVSEETIWTATPVVAADASFYLTFNGESGTDKYFEIDWIEVWE